MLRITALLLFACHLHGAGFRAAVVKVDITPSTPKWLLGYGARQSTGVHDRIYHRIAALDDGRAQFYLVSTDLCLFSPTVYDDFAQRLKKQTGIDPVQVWWSVTHTHSAPEVGPPGIYKVLLKGRSEHTVDTEYTELVIASAIGGIQDARAKLEPARLGVGVGISFANINRRAKDVDGRISLGLNPDGPVDRQLGIIRLERPDGTTLGLIANYAIHGTVLSGKYVEISGDVAGTVSTYIEEKLRAPLLFINAAAGNIAPIYSVYPDPRSGHLSQFNVLLGDRILAANRTLGPATGEVTLWSSEKIIETPRKAGLGWPEDMPAYERTNASGTALVRLPLRFLKINDTVIWAAPVEMFCDIAMNIRNRSPFAHTFYFGYTNGWLGYLPTRYGFEEGGYEPNTSPFSDQVERDVTEGVISYLQSIPR